MPRYGADKTWKDLEILLPQFRTTDDAADNGRDARPAVEGRHLAPEAVGVDVRQAALGAGAKLAFNERREGKRQERRYSVMASRIPADRRHSSDVHLGALPEADANDLVEDEGNLEPLKHIEREGRHHIMINSQTGHDLIHYLPRYEAAKDGVANGLCHGRKLE